MLELLRARCAQAGGEAGTLLSRAA